MFSAVFFLILILGYIALLLRIEKVAASVASLEQRLRTLQQGEVTAASSAPSPLQPTPAPAPVPMAVSKVAPRRSRSRAEWEALIGGKLLNRIGALAFIIGVGLFLKYAFENNWITETFRVLFGAGAGLASLWLASRTRRKGFEIFSQGLVGTGIAVLYLSVYASFNFYHLVPQVAAFLLMAFITAIAFSQALQYNSLAVSLLGWLGGYLTPFLLKSGEQNEIGLFTYLVILAAGILVVLWQKRRWTVLEMLTLLATYGVYFTWYASDYTTDQFWTTAVFVFLFWGLFHSLDLFFELKAEPLPALLRRTLAWTNWLLAFIAISLAVGRLVEDSLSSSAAVFALLYGLSAAILARLRPQATSSFLQQCQAAALLLAFAVGWQFERFSAPVAWTVIAVLLFFLGAQRGQRALRQTGEVFLFLPLIGLLTSFGALAYEPIGLFVPFWNLRALAFSVLVAGLAAGAILLSRTGEKTHAELFHYGWIGVLLLFLSVETSDIVRSSWIGAVGLNQLAKEFQRWMAIAVLWGLGGLSLTAASRQRFLRPLYVSGLGLLLLGSGLGCLRGIAFQPLERFVPLLNLRVLGLVLIGAANVFALSFLKALRGIGNRAGEFSTVLRILVALLLTALLTGECRDLFEHAIRTGGTLLTDEEVSRLQNLKQLCLSGVWLLTSVGLMIFGLWRRFRALRLMAMVLFGFTILKIFGYDLSFLEPLYRFISFLALGIILLIVSYLYQRYRTIILGPSVE